MGILIEKDHLPRVVIVGGGFGGLQLARSIDKSIYQVVLIDKNNYYQFQPLFYQVATCGLESSSIVFPFRKIFQNKKGVYFRMAEVQSIQESNKKVITSLGEINYDYLVLATGAGNNFFGNTNIEKYAIPMKSLTESLNLRNSILERFEQALNVSENERNAYLTFVVAGGGPTGTELAGALAEMKSHILPKDYPEMDFSKMRIILVEGGNRVLGAMDEKLSEKAHLYLKELGVDVQLATLVEDYDGLKIQLNDNRSIESKTLIWSAGVRANSVDGLANAKFTKGNRFQVNATNQIEGCDAIFAIGDVAAITSEKFPFGHPQMAQPAIQQAKNLAKNLNAKGNGKKLKPFIYKNLGSMATIGRNKAVVQLPKRQLVGFVAWFLWMFVHLRSIFGIKNKWIIFINWTWNYFTYNSSLRLIIKRKPETSHKTV